MNDPFGITELADGIIVGWNSSPTRLAEDLAHERDISEIDYAGRVLVEMVANAADAAAELTGGGRVGIWFTGSRLHIANTGLPLTRAGVESLSALRVSNKNDDATQISVGRFGVGFHSVAGIADEVEIRSRSGSVLFSKEKTALLLGTESKEVPLVRLPFVSAELPQKPWDTEIILDLRPEFTGQQLVVDFKKCIPELLLGLPQIAVIEVAGDSFERVVNGNRVTIGSRSWQSVKLSTAHWYVEYGISDEIIPLKSQLLCLPTPSDIELSIPVRVIASLATTPDRRSLHPEVDISVLARGYDAVIREVPLGERLAVVPQLAFPANKYDAQLSAAIIEELSSTRWLPGADGSELVPVRARVFYDLSDLLAAVLGEVLGDLVHPDLSVRSYRKQFEALGVVEVEFSEIISLCANQIRTPLWWNRFYSALESYSHDSFRREDLASLPIPLADGRLAIGPSDVAQLVGSENPAEASWLRLVHPEALHPLLFQLGMRQLSIAEALGDIGLKQLIADGDDEELTRKVLRILGSADVVELPSWIGGLTVVGADGLSYAADETIIESGPLAALLISDSPFQPIADEWLTEFGVNALRSIFVAWNFTLMQEANPVAAEHDLPDEEEWELSIGELPEALIALRDLDLVDPAQWKQALKHILQDPKLLPALAERNSYTCWWIRKYAEIDGIPVGHFCLDGDFVFNEIAQPLQLDLDSIDSTIQGALANCVLDFNFLDEPAINFVLAKFADSSVPVDPAAAALLYGAMGAAVASGNVHGLNISVPQELRVADGQTAKGAVIIDDSRWVDILSPADCIQLLPTSGTSALALAELLDVPLASEEFSVAVLSVPLDNSVTNQAFGVADAISQDWDWLTHTVFYYDELWLAVTDSKGNTKEQRVSRWQSAGEVHLVKE